MAARRAHNPQVAGSSPAPATNADHGLIWQGARLIDYNHSGEAQPFFIWQGSSVVEQRTHKPLVAGSNPAPATLK